MVLFPFPSFLLFLLGGFVAFVLLTGDFVIFVEPFAVFPLPFPGLLDGDILGLEDVTTSVSSAKEGDLVENVGALVLLGALELGNDASRGAGDLVDDEGALVLDAPTSTESIAQTESMTSARTKLRFTILFCTLIRITS